MKTPTPGFGIARLQANPPAFATPGYAESTRKTRRAPKPTLNQIRRRALEICHQRGETGEPYLLDWLHAERELNATMHILPLEVTNKE